MYKTEPGITISRILSMCLDLYMLEEVIQRMLSPVEPRSGPRQLEAPHPSPLFLECTSTFHPPFP